MSEISVSAVVKELEASGCENLSIGLAERGINHAIHVKTGDIFILTVKDKPFDETAEPGPNPVISIMIVPTREHDSEINERHMLDGGAGGYLHDHGFVHIRV